MSSAMLSHSKDSTSVGPSMPRNRSFSSAIVALSTKLMDTSVFAGFPSLFSTNCASDAKGSSASSSSP